jgi:rhodanese-related sulfurtransferase
VKIRWGIAFGVTALALTAVVYADRWDLIKRQIDRSFPEVPKITTAELAALMADSHALKPLLLDVRTQPEFAISHLAGAQHVEPKSDPATLKLPERKDTPIITYCSVGYRSAEFARSLRGAGYTNVRNLEGSIFQWANEGRPLDPNGTSKQKVHPYSRFWSGLVKKERRAEIPAAK